MFVSLRTKFHVSSIILTRFILAERRIGGRGNLKQTPKKPTQIRVKIIKKT